MHKLRTRTLAVAAGVLMAGGFVALATGPAAAAANPECKTVTTKLSGRPDSGLHGDWATDAFTRTVTFCETIPAPPQPAADVAAESITKSIYTATVADNGTFTTIDGSKSPVGGVNLPSGVKGSMTGSFSATFKAKPAFGSFKSGLNAEYSGTTAPKTSEWVEKAWGGNLTYLTNDLTDNTGWKWTYWTCSTDVAKATETWVNAAPDVNTGDITGKACPTVAPVVLPAPTASSPAPAASLPVTGSNTGILAGGAAVLIALGVGGVLIGRRRRFTA